MKTSSTFLAFIAFMLGGGLMLAIIGSTPSTTSAQDTKIEANKIGYVDLDRVLLEDITLNKARGKIKQALINEENEINDEYAKKLRASEKETKKHRAGDEAWRKIFSSRAEIVLEGLEAVADSQRSNDIDRDKAIVQAFERIDARIKEIADEMGLNTVIRIHEPSDDFSKADRAIYRVKLQNVLFSEPAGRNITSEVIARLNKGLKVEVPAKTIAKKTESEKTPAKTE